MPVKKHYAARTRSISLYLLFATLHRLYLPFSFVRRYGLNITTRSTFVEGDALRIGTKFPNVNTRLGRPEFTFGRHGRLLISSMMDSQML